MKPRVWIVTLAIALAVGGVWLYLRQRSGVVPSLSLGLTALNDEWRASGFVEAEQVALAPELAGRIAALPFGEGDEVRAGEVVLELEDDLLSAQVEAARAKLEEAQATLARVKAGARKETGAKFEAQVALAWAARDGARQAWLDAQAVRDNPQVLDVQIAAARAQAEAARNQYHAALAQRDIAEEAWKNYGKGSDKLAEVPLPYRPALPTSFYLIPYQWEQALAATDAAKAAYEGAQSALNHLLGQRSNPLEAQAQVNTARARYESADAAVIKAQAALEAVQAGATAEQVAAAQAQVNVAQAALDAAQVQLGKATLRAPTGGVVVARSVYTGELAAPGVTALTLADLDSVKLTLYVPGGELGQLALGQTFQVGVDAFPDRTFSGVVAYVSDKAEYTPRNVRSPDQRATLVYAVRLKISNPDHALKPGMPVDVTR